MQSALRSQDPKLENPSGLSSPGSRFGSHPSPSQIYKLHQLKDKSFEVQNQLEVEMLNLQNTSLPNTQERSQTIGSDAGANEVPLATLQRLELMK